jgi:hypothetical protein
MEVGCNQSRSVWFVSVQADLHSLGREGGAEANPHHTHTVVTENVAAAAAAEGSKGLGIAPIEVRWVAGNY